MRALEIATEKSSFEPNLLQPSTHAPVQASGILSSSFASSYVKKGRGGRVTSVQTLDQTFGSIGLWKNLLVEVGALDYLVSSQF